jgi:hypothetical protein
MQLGARGGRIRGSLVVANHGIRFLEIVRILAKKAALVRLFPEKRLDFQGIHAI